MLHPSPELRASSPCFDEFSSPKPDVFVEDSVAAASESEAKPFQVWLADSRFW